MKAIGEEAGRLLNFASMPLTIKRVGREQIMENGKEEDPVEE